MATRDRGRDSGGRSRRSAPASRRTASARRSARRSRRNSGSDLAARVIVAVPAAVFAIVLIAAGGTVFAIGMFAFAVICMHELYGMYENARPVRLAGFIGAAGLIAAAHFGTQFNILLAAVAVIPVLFVLTMNGPARTSPTAAMALTLLGVYWIGFAFAHAVLLRDLPHGDAILIDVLVGTFLGDTGAYLGGKAFGSRPLAPSISPNKTVEGLGIGILTAVAAVWFAGLYQDWLSGADALLIGVAVAISAPVGDLFESAIKRDAGTKDTGRLFGAHGGALDRLDAVMFSVVVGYYVWVALL